MQGSMLNVGRMAEARANLRELTSHGVSLATNAAARLGASFSSDASYFESAMVPEKVICGQLDPSASIKDKLDAMKRILALISLGRDASHFFPHVVKNVVARSLEVKKLVYLYLVHYAEEQQDLALLSINAFQKDLTDPNQMIRALALRVLSSIRVPVILQIVVMAINQASRDSSPYVRKTAAHAIAKVASLAGTHSPTNDILYTPLQLLLADKSQLVLGSAVAVLMEIAPHRVDMLHPHFRRLCRSLVDLDQWSQVIVLEALLCYARTQLPRYPPADSTSSVSLDVDNDLALLLTSAALLFRCRNPAVVMAAASLHFHLVPLDLFNAKAVKPLMRLCHGSTETASLAFAAILPVAVRSPQVLLPYYQEFYLCQADGYSIRSFKSKILALLAVEMADAAAKDPQDHAIARQARATLEEVANQSRPQCKSDSVIATRAAATVGAMALKGTPPIVTRCLKILLNAVKTATTPEVVAEAVNSIRRLIQNDFESNRVHLRNLGKILCKGNLVVPQAKSSVLWLLGEFYEAIPNVALEALRVSTLSFSTDTTTVKLQTLTLAAKMLARHQTQDLLESPNKENTTGALSSRIAYHLFHLAQYDLDWDVRDQGRYLSKAFTGKAGDIGQVYQNALRTRKPLLSSGSVANPWRTATLLDDPSVQLGSVLHFADNVRLRLQRLPPWTISPSAPSVRAEPDIAEPFPGTVLSDKDHVSDLSLRNRMGADVYPDRDFRPTTLDEFYGSEEDHDEMGEDMNGHFSENHMEGDYSDDDEEEDSEGMEEERTDDDAYDTEEEVETNMNREAIALKIEKSRQPVLELVGGADNGPRSAIDLFLDSSGAINVTTTHSSANDDFLTELSSSSVFQPNAQPYIAPKHKWLQAVDSWKGEGLVVEYAFYIGVNSPKDERQLALRFVNTGKHAVQNVRSDEFPSVAQLSVPSQASFEVVLSIDCSSARDTRVHFLVEFDMLAPPLLKQIPIDIRPSVGDLLRPEVISLDEFLAEERRLGGMFTQEKVFDLVHTARPGVLGPTQTSFWQETTKKGLLESANLGLIGCTVNEPLLLHMPGRLCGQFCGSGGRVVVSITLAPGAESDNGVRATLRVGSDDVLLSANLLNHLRSNLQCSGGD